jgi:anti-sigma regulatory factor (Ser/Thr protein kinase)
VKNLDRSLSLRTPLELAFLSTVTSFTEEAAKALGMGAAEALKLTLASEEIYAYLSQVSPADGALEVQCRNGIYYLELTFRTHLHELDLHLFNLTARPDPLDESSLQQLGLLLASRSVEHFHIIDDRQVGLSLVLRKDRTYPPASGEPAPAEPLSFFRVGKASAEALILAASYLPSHYAAEFRPAGLEQPGRLLDMVASGEYAALAATDDRGRLGGLLVYSVTGGRTASLYGPYLFHQPPGSNMAAQLVEAALGSLGRSEALGVVCLRPSPDLPPEYFEPLGSLRVTDPEGRRAYRPCYYRQLTEDVGAVVWAHPSLEEFLLGFYQNLALARQINSAQAEGHHQPPHSVLAVEINRTIAQAVLRPILDGQDFAHNLAQHVKLLGGEGVTDLLAELDLGLAWQAALGGTFLEAGFQPRLVLPHGGSGDLLVLQHGAQ